jgi:hypothetical protein
MKKSIGLGELIKQVKAELLSTSNNSQDNPLLSVDSVELELQVTVQKEDNGQIGFNVLSAFSGEVSQGINQETIQRITVTLSPLLDKEKLLALYLKENPQQEQELIQQLVNGILKNPLPQNSSRNF